MSMTDNPTRPTMEPLSPEEFSVVVRHLRYVHGWTQETLAELSGLTVRTVQRVEQGKATSLDTRRAIARAFEIDDVDTFEKPFERKSLDDHEKEAKELHEKYLILKSRIAKSGKELVDVVEHSNALGFDLPSEPNEEIGQVIGSLFDNLREYLDCKELYSMSDRAVLYVEYMDFLQEIARMGYSICYATRTAKISNESWKDPTPMTWQITHFLAVKKGEEPAEFAVLRKSGISF